MTSFLPTVTVPLPSPHQVSIDVVEWWCHTILNEVPGPALQQRCLQLEDQCWTNHVPIPPFGRLHNRLQIVAVAQGICGRDSFDSDDSCETLTSDDWQALLQELHDCRNNLLRMDHNDVRGDENERIDEDLEQLPIFSEAFDEVVTLYQLQITICDFRDGLAQLIQHPPKSINKHLEALLLDYKAGITEGCKTGVLLTFVQNDILQAGPKKANPLQHITLLQKLLTDLTALMTTMDAEYSYNTLQRNVLELLKDWYVGNLKLPELVILGYGGLPPLPHTDSNDKHTVSSWGMDDAEREERRLLERGDTLENDDNQDNDNNGNHDNIEKAHNNVAHEIDDSDNSDGFHTATSGLLETQQSRIRTSIPVQCEDSDTEMEEVPDEQVGDISMTINNNNNNNKTVQTDDFSDVASQTLILPFGVWARKSEQEHDTAEIPVKQIEIDRRTDNCLAKQHPSTLKTITVLQKKGKSDQDDQFSDIANQYKLVQSVREMHTTQLFVVPNSLVMDEEVIHRSAELNDERMQTEPTQQAEENNDEESQSESKKLDNSCTVLPLPNNETLIANEGNRKEILEIGNNVGNSNTEGEEDVISKNEQGEVTSKKKVLSNKKQSSTKRKSASFESGPMGCWGEPATRKRQIITSSCYGSYHSSSRAQQPLFSFDIQKAAIRQGYISYGEDWSTVRANSPCLGVLRLYQIKETFELMCQSGEITLAIERSSEEE
jgi:hypothetical protein